MRFTLVLSLLIAILAVVFALQNPAYIDVNLGPFEINESTALILMVTFCVGVVVGILATVPTILKRRKQVRELERRTSDAMTGRPSAERAPHAGPPPDSGTTDYRPRE